MQTCKIKFNNRFYVWRKLFTYWPYLQFFPSSQIMPHLILFSCFPVDYWDWYLSSQRTVFAESFQIYSNTHVITTLRLCWHACKQSSTMPSELRDQLPVLSYTPTQTERKIYLLHLLQHFLSISHTVMPAQNLGQHVPDGWSLWEASSAARILRWCLLQRLDHKVKLWLRYNRVIGQTVFI